MVIIAVIYSNGYHASMITICYSNHYYNVMVMITIILWQALRYYENYYYNIIVTIDTYHGNVSYTLWELLP